MKELKIGVESTSITPSSYFIIIHNYFVTAVLYQTDQEPFFLGGN